MTRHCSAQGSGALLPDLLQSEARVRGDGDEQRHEGEQHQPAEKQQDLEA